MPILFSKTRTRKIPKRKRTVFRQTKVAQNDNLTIIFNFENIWFFVSKAILRYCSATKKSVSKWAIYAWPAVFPIIIVIGEGHRLLKVWWAENSRCDNEEPSKKKKIKSKKYKKQKEESHKNERMKKGTFNANNGKRVIRGWYVREVLKREVKKI